jgi:hypothetical protein
MNERSTWITTVSFFDEDNDPVTPDSASYRIDDVSSGTEVREDTDIETLATTVEIEWEPADTAILDDSRMNEKKRLTITWIYDTDKQGTAEYILNVKNLRGLLPSA